MALLEKHLYVRKSLLPGAGKGLFTKVLIPKGTRIVEYKGEILTWKEVEKMPDERNGYVFYFNLKHVIDAWKTTKSVAHFANDAMGIVKVKGIRNNADYVTSGKRCFIEAIRDIPARSEIFVDYGREYWQAIRYNIREEQRKARTTKANGKHLPHHKIPKRVAHPHLD
ncbi:MAG: SET domain-containing protein [Cyclobacteriaceae bacterium]|nr:SET domain-containing protein [Cyclobacteriaceae bacterium]